MTQFVTVLKYKITIQNTNPRQAFATKKTILLLI